MWPHSQMGTTPWALGQRGGRVPFVRSALDGTSNQKLAVGVMQGIYIYIYVN